MDFIFGINKILINNVSKSICSRKQCKALNAFFVLVYTFSDAGFIQGVNFSDLYIAPLLHGPRG